MELVVSDYDNKILDKPIQNIYIVINLYQSYILFVMVPIKTYPKKIIGNFNFLARLQSARFTILVLLIVLNNFYGLYFFICIFINI